MAQTLYYNGTILTMEDRRPQVEAVLTEDGRILDTGTWDKVKERAGDKTRRLDLQGRVMLPGFIDAHSHFTACASHTMEVDLGGACSFEDIITCIRQYIADKKINLHHRGVHAAGPLVLKQGPAGCNYRGIWFLGDIRHVDHPIGPARVVSHLRPYGLMNPGADTASGMLEGGAQLSHHQGIGHKINGKYKNPGYNGL